MRKKRSDLHGFGVFAQEPINKNKRIIDYAGEKIPARISRRREAHQLARGKIWCFEINRNWCRDAERGGNVARFINHACRPNCYVRIIGDVIWIVAARHIRDGEELTYNYNTTGSRSIPCRCHQGCTNRI